MIHLILSIVLTGVFLAGSVAGLGGYVGLVFEPDPLLVLVMVVFPLLYQLVLHGPFFVKAFSVPFRKDPAESSAQETLKGAYHFFKGYEAVVWTTAITTAAAYLIILTKALEDRAGLGPAYVFLASVFLYAGLLHLLIVLPYKAVIKKQLASAGK
jgi:hypothetical protein